MMRRLGCLALLLSVSSACANQGESPSPTASVPDPNEGLDSTPVHTDEPLDTAGGNTEPKAGAEEASPPPPKYEPRPEDLIEPHSALLHPERLNYFFDSLTELDEGKERPVRVIHLGASIIGGDDLTSMLREKFQTRFGDGGAGLVLMQRYMTNYKHNWVKLEGSGWEHCYIAYVCKKDGHYGLGGVTFLSTGGGKTKISTRKKTPGDRASHIELWYAADKGAGKLEFKVDNDEPTILPGRAEAIEDRYHVVDVEPGPHTVSVRARGGGKARAYGVVMETKSGVVWDQFSMLGAFTKRLSKWNQEHISGQVKQRDADLVIFTYGGNDSRRVTNGQLSKDQYVREFTDVVERVRKGKPDMSCLIITITDRTRSLNFDIKSKDLQILVDAQYETADKTGCAVFDMFEAMGGGGSLRKWRKTKPPLAAPDMKHLSHAGRKKMADWMYDSIVAAYVEHRRRS